MWIPPDIKAFGTERKGVRMEDPTDHPVAATWGDVLADMEATAEGFEEDGWETLEIHPGDVTVLEGGEGERFGLDVLVADNEYEAVQDRIESGFDVDEYEVFTANDEGYVFVLVALKDRDRRTALFVPMYYSVSGKSTYLMLKRAKERGVIHTYLRRLDGEYIEFTHDDPELFQPSDPVE